MHDTAVGGPPKPGPKVAVKKVSLPAKETVEVGDYVDLTPVFNDGETTPSNTTVTWASDDPDVAEVNENGRVTGRQANKSATITVTTEDGKRTATCKVDVTPYVESAVIDTTTTPGNVHYKVNAPKTDFEVGTLQLRVSYRGGGNGLIDFKNEWLADDWSAAANDGTDPIAITYKTGSGRTVSAGTITTICVYAVTVITVTQPTKLVYGKGESFDPTGLSLLVKWDSSNIADEPHNYSDANNGGIVLDLTAFNALAAQSDSVDVGISWNGDGSNIDPITPAAITVSAYNLAIKDTGGTLAAIADAATLSSALASTGGGDYTVTLYDDVDLSSGITMNSTNATDAIELKGATVGTTPKVISNSGTNVVSLTITKGVFTLGSGIKLTGPSTSTAALVSVGATYGTLNMTGGEISGHTNSGDGTVAVAGAFNMSGGTISGNTAANGGAVKVTGTGSFTMSGTAEISGNTATANGGAVNVAAGTFTMSGGSIIGNTAATKGGGVYIADGVTFSKTSAGGIIGGTGAANNVCTAGATNGVQVYWNNSTVGTGTHAWYVDIPIDTTDALEATAADCDTVTTLWQDPS